MTRAAFLPRQAKYVLAPSRLLELKKKIKIEEKRGSGGSGVRGPNVTAFWVVSGPRAGQIKKI